MKKFLLPLFAIAVIPAIAQELPYTFSTFNEPYNDLVGSTSVNNGEIWDDPEYAVPIGFNFDFMGQNMTQIGILYPGAQLIPIIMGDLVNVFLIYQSDIMDAGAIGDESLSPISYLLEGEVGSRILKIEWKNVAFYGELETNGTTNNTTNFQLWLYEGTNDFEYRFGNNTVKEPDMVHFLGKPIVGVGKNVSMNSGEFEAIWLLDGNPSDPAVYNMPNDGSKPSPDNLLDGEPVSGTVYHFDTGIVGVNELKTNVAMQLYPTFADEQINLIWGGNFPATTEIYDATGKIVQSFQVNSALEQIDISVLSAGCYVLRTHDGINMSTEKFFVR